MKQLKLITFLMPLSIISIPYVFAQSTIRLDDIKHRVQSASNMLTTAEKNDDVKSFLTFYEENAISIPDYQPMLVGRNDIGAYYKAIFQRQRVKSFDRKTQEVIYLGKSTIVEIGTFKKEYRNLNADSVITLQGKYCHIWNIQSDNGLKIKGEVVGYFHPVQDPVAFVVDSQISREPEIHPEAEIPIELRAYNALMEKYVKNGEGALRSQFFTEDGKFMPFAHPTLSGMKELRPYLIAYDTRGSDFKFDSISVYTYHYEYFDDYVLEYPKFKVKWSTPSLSGRAEGKSIRIWKRQNDKSLKLYIEIATHDYLP